MENHILCQLLGQYDQNHHKNLLNISHSTDEQNKKLNFYYANFDHDKIIFLSSNVDTLICKELSYFVYEALQIRNYTNRQV